ncbi:MAG: helix-turn-helix domain-containing protein [Candidatus Margulisbacteria bacterium]|jgi:transcriptional regulator with XRE-family HTH domain|nr:helix-turn-helix domain-containing protein [Candidatus Margulisiibacteriota bacterium]
MSLRQTFIGNLKKLRKGRQLSQMQLSLDCEMSSTYIAEIEMGRKFPSVEAVEKIAGVLRVPAYSLFWETRNSYRKKSNLLAIPPVIREDIIAKLPEIIGSFIRKY